MEQLRIDIEPKKLLIISEPYITYTSRGYQPVINVLDKKKKREYFIYISAKSLSQRLEQLRSENNGYFTGIEFWIKKESEEKYAKYIIED